LRDELAVADQVGVIAQARELAAQFVARRCVGRRVLDVGHQPRQCATQFGDRILDRLRLDGNRLRRFAETFRDQRRDDPFAIGALVQYRVDVEPEPRQRFGEQFQSLLVDRRVGIGISLDLRLAQRQQAVGVVELQNAQRATNLLAVLRKRRKLGPARVVAEERIEHLLHVAQVRAHFAHHLRQQHALLRLLRHFVEHGRRRRRRASGARGVETLQHRLDLLAEFGRQVVEVLERALGEQQRRRELHRQRLRNAVGRHVGQARDEARRQPRQRGMLDLRRLRIS
jgi:hypothetical protein